MFEIVWDFGYSIFILFLFNLFLIKGEVKLELFIFLKDFKFNVVECKFLKGSINGVSVKKILWDFCVMCDYYVFIIDIFKKDVVSIFILCDNWF